MSNELSLAAIGYDVYGATTDHKNYQGLPMPDWDALPEKQKTAWHAAADAIGMALMEAGATENLSFGQALEFLKLGHKVARAIWGGYWQLEDARFPTSDTGTMCMIVAHLKDGGEAPAQPYQADLLANDWKIIS